MRVVSKLCKSFIKYLVLLKIMYNNFTNTLIYKNFHILNTSIALFFVAWHRYCYPLRPQIVKCSPPPLSPIQFFFFSSNFKTTHPLIIFTYFIFFLFYKLLISPSNFLYNAIYILCLLFVLLYVYSFVITHLRGGYMDILICTIFLLLVLGVFFPDD